MSRTTPTWMPPGATAAATGVRALPSSKPSKKQRQLASTDCGSLRQRWYSSSRASTLAIDATDELMVVCSVDKQASTQPAGAGYNILVRARRSAADEKGEA